MRALQLYQEMKDAGIAVDAVTYTTLLSALRQAPREARRIWDEMVASGVLPDSICASLYLGILLGAGNTEAAMDLLRSAMSGRLGLNAADLVEQALSMATSKQDEVLMRKCLDLMREQRVPHTAGTAAEVLVARASKRGKQGLWMLRAGDTGLGDVALQLEGTPLEDALAWALGETEGLTQSADGGMHGHAAVVAAGLLAIDNLLDTALELYGKVAPQLEMGMRAWMLKMLLFGAYNAPPEQRNKHLLRVLKEARHWTDHGGRWRWDRRTQRAVARFLRRSPEAEGLEIDEAEVDESAQALLGRKK